ncbi:glycoside hydrolase superfamily [Mycena rebaudengoi]|nr:glycoside hydrolase superfamily [Mycena rebaudengoi]
MPPVISVAGHTTASTPRPHILYKFNINREGTVDVLHKRYSEFASLHTALGVSSIQLPPKRLLAQIFIPSAWVDDTLIAERKAGLEAYLTSLVALPQYRESEVLQEFLAPSIPLSSPHFDPEDALPSTLSRKTAQALGESILDATAAKFLAASYYTSWSAYGFPPESLDYSKFDILFYAFAIPDTSGALIWDSDAQAFLKRLVASAKKSGKGTKIVLSVGGWTGSAAFHQIAGNSSTRNKFVSTLSSTVSKFGLDGIDIDWEYPNSGGAGNPYGPTDTANFLTLLTALRKSLGTSKIISAAVTDLPFLGSNGTPLKDVSAFSAQLTYVNIMNYDIFGSWSGAPGPNAPLGNLCGTSSQPAYTAQAAFTQWTTAKFPASKLLLGLPLYGYVYKSTKTKLTASLVGPEDEEEAERHENAADAASEEAVVKISEYALAETIEETVEEGGDEATPIEEPPVGGGIRGANKRPFEPEATSEATEALTVNDPLSEVVHPLSEIAHPLSEGTEVGAEGTTNLSKWWGQQIPFSSLVSSGALVKKADGTYGKGGGFAMGWDNCSDTPYLFNTAQKTVVSYDDTWSLANKAAFAKSKGMAGCFTWSMDQDDGVTLQNTIRKALGK